MLLFWINIGKINNKNIFTIQLELSSDCNLRCIHCYHDTPKITDSSLETNLVFKQIDELKTNLKIDTLKLHLSGGEPFLLRNLREVLVKIRNYETTIITNGTLIDKLMIFRLIFVSLPVIQISLDSSESCIHDYIRGEGVFNLVMESINNLNKYGFILTISTVLLKGINDNNFEKLFQLCMNKGIKAINFSRFFPQGRSKNLDKYTFTDGREYKKVLQNLIKAASKFPELIIIIKDPLINNLSNLPSNIEKDICCYIGDNFLSIDSKGNVYACRKLGIVIGNLYEQTLTQIWRNSKKLKELIDRSEYIHKKCTKCHNFIKCKGGCLAAALNYKNSKKLFNSDPGCWIL